MHTLHEFFFFTKALEYLIGVIFLISFVYFYRFLFNNSGEDTE